MRRQTYLYLKRALDVTASLAGLLATAPLQAFVAVAVLKNLGRPILFCQERPGQGAKPFRLYKFRTMLQHDPARDLVTNEQRLTRFGQLLRSTSLDELPSLWNVLRGDMSLVGPRPLRLHYLPRYSRYHAKRHQVRPGLTGLAQVSGRNELDWNERLDLDIEYVENLSFTLDSRILARTLINVIRRKGVQEQGQASKSEFLGSGPKLTYRPLAESDLPTRVAWLNHPRVREGITIDFVANLPDTTRWYLNIRTSTERHDYVTVDEAHRRIAMFGFTNRDGECAELYLYVNPELQGKGYGRLTMVQALKAAENLELSEIRLQTSTDNYAAQRLYRRFGFRKVGDGSSNKVEMTLSLEHREVSA